MSMQRGVVAIAAAAWLLSGCAGGSADGDTAYAERMADEHAGDRPEASEAARRDPGAEVVASEVVYATFDDGEITGYLAMPVQSAAPPPGVIVIQEWWGLNDNIRSMARQLAAEGYAALAVDLYEGEVAEDPQAARELMTAAMQRAERLEQHLVQAAGYLRDEIGSPRIGTIGWCFGGAWSLRAALALGDGVDASVIYYGRLVTDEAELAGLTAPVLGLFGEADGGIPVDGVRAFEATLAKLGKSAEIHVYPGAEHAFANPSGTRYDAAAAEDAWDRTTRFLAAHLKDGPRE